MTEEIRIFFRTSTGRSMEILVTVLPVCLSTAIFTLGSTFHTLPPSVDEVAELLIPSL